VSPIRGTQKARPGCRSPSPACAVTAIVRPLSSLTRSARLLAVPHHAPDVVVRGRAVRLADQQPGGGTVQVHPPVVLDRVDRRIVDELEQAGFGPAGADRADGVADLRQRRERRHERDGRDPGGKGRSRSVAEVMTPSAPSDPISSDVRSYPATFLRVPLPVRSTVPSARKHSPAAAAAGVDQYRPAADHLDARAEAGAGHRPVLARAAPSRIGVHG
jgi:hypothetical protein